MCRYGLDYKRCPWAPGVNPDWVEWATGGGSERPKCAWKAIKLPDHRHMFPWPELVVLQKTIQEEGFEEPTKCPDCEGDEHFVWIDEETEEGDDETEGGDEPDLVENDNDAVIDDALEGMEVALMGITDGKYLPN